jgi:hypothetical protein
VVIDPDDEPAGTKCRRAEQHEERSQGLQNDPPRSRLPGPSRSRSVADAGA